MKIFTNVQTSHVAGISRVMSSLGEYIRSAKYSKDIELVCLSLDKKATGEVLWRTEREKGNTMLVYGGILPDFGETIRSARYLDDVRDAYAPLTEAFRQKLIEEAPDVVLANGTYVVPWCLVMAARSLRLPVVLYYHGSLSKETEHWDNAPARRMIRRMEASFDRADIKFLFPSELIKKYVEQEVFCRPTYRKHTVVLPNPIPEAFFRARRRESAHRIGFVGRWTRIKNTAFLVRFVEINRKAGKPFDIYVLTDPASRKHAVKLLHDHVQYVRPRAHSRDLAAFYARMSAIICPSHFETYGNVAQEAVAVGTPAYVSGNMGVAEIFRKVGLEELIVDFSKPREVFKALRDSPHVRISRIARRALKKAAGAPVVHKKLLDFLRI